MAAIRLQKNGMAPGQDNRMADIFKVKLEIKGKDLQPLIEATRDQRQLPGDCTEGVIAKISNVGTGAIAIAGEESSFYRRQVKSSH